MNLNVFNFHIKIYRLPALKSRTRCSKSRSLQTHGHPLISKHGTSSYLHTSSNSFVSVSIHLFYYAVLKMFDIYNVSVIISTVECIK